MTLQTSFHIACSSAANAVDAVAAQKLRLVSPPEMVFAILLAVARDVQAQDPDKIAEWRDLLTGVPCTMHFLNGEDKRHIFAVQQRENYAQNANSMRLTALQKLFDVQSVMERKKTATGAATLEELAKYYENVTWAKDSDPVSYSFLQEAHYILKHVFPYQGCLNVLLELEKLGRGNPLDGCGKISKLVRRAGAATNSSPVAPETLQKILEFLADYWVCKYFTEEKFSERALEGKQPKCDGKGTVDLVLMKIDALEFLRGKFMDMRDFQDGLSN